MNILITGSAGFLGRRLMAALLSGAAGLPLDRLTAADTVHTPTSDDRVGCRIGSITDEGFVESLVAPGVDVVFHLAAVLSGQAEAEFDRGMQVNVDATRRLLEACRRLPAPPRFVFSSTIAVFGGSLPLTVPEDLAARPESSYGAEKVIAEYLVTEYSRRAFVDGVVCRVPTVAVRPGVPNSAVSSFVSGIIREPLAGLESVCPVPLDTRLWIASPDVVTFNLLHSATLPASALEGGRTLNLPGLTVTPAEMLSSLERLGGTAARARVRPALDPLITRIVSSWPGAFDVDRLLALGFRADPDFDSILRQFLTGERPA